MLLMLFNFIFIYDCVPTSGDISLFYLKLITEHVGESFSHFFFATSAKWTKREEVKEKFAMVSLYNFDILF